MSVRDLLAYRRCSRLGGFQCLVRLERFNGDSVNPLRFEAHSLTFTIRDHLVLGSRPAAIVRKVTRRPNCPSATLLSAHRFPGLQ